MAEGSFAAPQGDAVIHSDVISTVRCLSSKAPEVQQAEAAALERMFKGVAKHIKSGNCGAAREMAQICADGSTHNAVKSVFTSIAHSLRMGHAELAEEAVISAMEAAAKLMRRRAGADLFSAKAAKIRAQEKAIDRHLVHPSPAPVPKAA